MFFEITWKSGKLNFFASFLKKVKSLSFTIPVGPQMTLANDNSSEELIKSRM